MFFWRIDAEENALVATLGDRYRSYAAQHKRLIPFTLFTTTLLIVRNQRILAAWNARQEKTQRRAAAGLPPRTRRRRKALASLTGAGPP